MSGSGTPHLSTTTSFPPTSSATPGPPSQNAPPGLPNPATFDFLPDLAEILSRLIQTPPQPADPTAPPTQPSTDGPLEIHQLGTAATEVKRKIQRAKALVMALPDIDRTIEDQQEEIDDLQARITHLKKVLAGMANLTSGDATTGQKDQENTDDDKMMTR